MKALASGGLRVSKMSGSFEDLLARHPTLTDCSLQKGVVMIPNGHHGDELGGWNS